MTIIRNKPAQMPTPVLADAVERASYIGRIEALERCVDQLMLERTTEARTAVSPEVWQPLKRAAAMADVSYETAREWCAHGRVNSRKPFGRVEVDVASMIDHRVRTTGR